METIFLHHPIKTTQEPIDKVMALGFFDGVHRGHQKVIQTAKNIAAKKGMKVAILTFDPHPSVVLSKKRTNIKYLTPLFEKEKKIASLGVDILYVVRFTTAFSNLSPAEFVEKYLIALSAKYVIAGFDYSYGKKGAGNMQDLIKYAANRFEVIMVDKQKAYQGKISSTKIRQYIENGQLEEANELLGYPYKVSGTVIHGDKRGRTIGFPTANILVGQDFLLPKQGVYAVQFRVNGKTYSAMASIGYNITFKDDQVLSVEVYILDFNQEIYGEDAEIEWFHFFRPELKFNGVEGLIEQLKQDEIDTRIYFNSFSERK